MRTPNGDADSTIKSAENETAAGSTDVAMNRSGAIIPTAGETWQIDEAWEGRGQEPVWRNRGGFNTPQAEALDQITESLPAVPLPEPHEIATEVRRFGGLLDVPGRQADVVVMEGPR
jgi:hypothetical protein